MSLTPDPETDHARIALITLAGPLDAIGPDGLTPLMRAAVQGDAALVDALCRAGVDVDDPDEHGRTALHHAARAGHSTIIEALIRHGAAIDARDKAARTPLTHAVECRAPATVTTLLAARADPDGCAEERWATTDSIPLHLAARQGHLDIVRALLDAGATVNLLSEDHESALALAAEEGQGDVVEVLRSRGGRRLFQCTECKDRGTVGGMIEDHCDECGAFYCPYCRSSVVQDCPHLVGIQISAAFEQGLVTDRGAPTLSHKTYPRERRLREALGKLSTVLQEAYECPTEAPDAIALASDLMDHLETPVIALTWEAHPSWRYGVDSPVYFSQTGAGAALDEFDELFDQLQAAFKRIDIGRFGRHGCLVRRRALVSLPQRQSHRWRVPRPRR